MIALKCTVRDFYNLLSAPQTVSNMYARESRMQSCANHVKHIALSHATCRAMCHEIGRDSSAIKFDRVEIAFILPFILFAEPLMDEGGKETGVPRENTRWFFFFFFFSFPSYISGVHHFWVRFLRMWPFLNPTIKVVTFRLRGWCVLGVFLLPAFTCLGHERQDLLSPCDEMHVCTD